MFFHQTEVITGLFLKLRSEGKYPSEAILACHRKRKKEKEKRKVALRRHIYRYLEREREREKERERERERGQEEEATCHRRNFGQARGCGEKPHEPDTLYI